MAGLRSKELGELRAVDHATPQGLSDFLTELIFIRSHQLGGLMVQGIIRVGLNEQEDQA